MVDKIMQQPVYDPSESGKKMVIVCFVSGSGTNYREIVAQNRDHKYVVFTNRPGCGGVAIAGENTHAVIELSHIPYLREAKKRYGSGNVPRNCPERAEYEQQISRLIESSIGAEPDLICLAGYDQWLSDWMVDKYYPRILNVHPGDTTKGYDGLHWVPSAKAILAGDEAIRSTLFIVDKGEDTGPVLVQSKPVNIAQTLAELEYKGAEGLSEGLSEVISFATTHNIKTYEDFEEKAGAGLLEIMGNICRNLQDILKVKGDWNIYPFAVHELIAKGRVQIADRTVYVDGREMPEYGYRID
ncbi:phosphoribosylglycinamide formyltransferase [Chloroflexota bacterium]